MFGKSVVGSYESKTPLALRLLRKWTGSHGYGKKLKVFVPLLSDNFKNGHVEVLVFVNGNIPKPAHGSE